MVKQMNKHGLIKRISQELNCDETKSKIICETLENNFFFSKKNKEKIIEELKLKLNTGEEETTKIYEISISIIKGEIKDKLKHPFKSQN